MKNANYYEDLHQFVGIIFDCDWETYGLTYLTPGKAIFFWLKDVRPVGKTWDMGSKLYFPRYSQYLTYIPIV